MIIWTKTQTRYKKKLSLLSRRRTMRSSKKRLPFWLSPTITLAASTSTSTRLRTASKPTRGHTSLKGQELAQATWRSNSVHAFDKQSSSTEHWSTRRSCSKTKRPKRANKLERRRREHQLRNRIHTLNLRLKSDTKIAKMWHLRGLPRRSQDRKVLMSSIKRKRRINQTQSSYLLKLSK